MWGGGGKAGVREEGTTCNDLVFFCGNNTNSYSVHVTEIRGARTKVSHQASETTC